MAIRHNRIVIKSEIMIIWHNTSLWLQWHLLTAFNALLTAKPLGRFAPRVKLTIQIVNSRNFCYGNQ